MWQRTRCSSIWRIVHFLICVWINGWVNNGEAGDLRRYRAHNDVIEMANQSFKHSVYQCPYKHYKHTLLFGLSLMVGNTHDLKVVRCCPFTAIPLSYQHQRPLNTLMSAQNGRHFPDDIRKAFSWMKIYEIPLRFVPKVGIENITALVQIMAWRRPGAHTRHSASMC